MLKLPTKRSFWAVASLLATAVGYLVSSGAVPPAWAGVVGAVGTLLGAIMEHAPKDAP